MSFCNLTYMKDLFPTAHVFCWPIKRKIILELYKSEWSLREIFCVCKIGGPSVPGERLKVTFRFDQFLKVPDRSILWCP